MITIGLPKGLFYFEHHMLWKQFFRNLGYDVVVSDDTNKQVMDYGVKHCSNETCLPVKVFHGHVYSLKDKVDYVFIPRYISLDNKEYACPKFCGLPDITLLNLKRQIRVLEVRLHVDMYPSQTFESLKELSNILNINYLFVIDAFKSASKAFIEYRKNYKSRFQDGINSNDMALSILGHPYMIQDSYLSMNLIDKLKNRGIVVYTPQDISYDEKRKNAYPFQGKVFWNIGFELLGSAYTFADSQNIKGLIYLTPFACGVDAFVIELIERRLASNYNIPFLKLSVDEHTGEAGFDTRLEAFLDMMG